MTLEPPSRTLTVQVKGLELVTTTGDFFLNGQGMVSWATERRDGKVTMDRGLPLNHSSLSRRLSEILKRQKTSGVRAAE